MAETILPEQTIASPGHRIGATAVDFGLYTVTLGIGHFIWNLIVMAQGQSPGKQLLKVRVMNEVTKKPATWGHMAIRNYLIPIAFAIPFYLTVINQASPVPFADFIYFDGQGLNSLISIFSVMGYIVFLVLDAVWMFRTKRKRLVDLWVKTYVINEANVTITETQLTRGY